jgi:hypothetical protein
MTHRSLWNGMQVCAGLALAPLAWIAAMQLSQILPYLDCARQGNTTAIAVSCGLVVALLGVGFSWRRSRGTAREHGRTRSFIAGLGWTTALVITLALAFQLTASLMLSACEH